MVRKLVLLGALSLAAPEVASARMIVVLTDPMGLERRTVVIETPGPPRVLLCSAPPAVFGCREVPVKSRR